MSGLIGAAFELGALAIVADTVKDVMGSKKKKKVVEHHEESFW